MFTKFVLLGSVSAALLDAGMRDVKAPPGIPQGAATYKVDPTTRADCVDGKALLFSRSTPLLNGQECSDKTAQATCLTAYEHKTRHDHRANPTELSNGHSLKGEIHLCEWREQLSGHRCEAGKMLLVCPEDDVVQVSNKGKKSGPMGDARVTGVLPGSPAGLPAAMQPKGDENNYRTPYLETSHYGAFAEKAQGTCGEDAYTCPTGETVLRDPLLSCRFAPCAGQTSLVEASNQQPTYHWNGVSISDDQSFCARMTTVLGDYQDLSTGHSGQGCTTMATTDCTNHYHHLIDGNVGDIAHCKLNSDGDSCVDGAIHNCTWTFYMEDLIRKHNDTTDNCAAKLLESKRSLDGLLHSVQDVYNQLMQWNAIVQAENGTIRTLLQEQQSNWDEYVSCQIVCDSLYASDQSNIDLIMKEMTELRAIANPDVRSAVDVRARRGYQSSGVTSESCPATFPFVSNKMTNGVKDYCCLTLQDRAKILASEMDDLLSDKNCTKRSCTDPNEMPVSCVDNHRAGGHGTLNPSQAASFAELDTANLDLSEASCEAFSSLAQRVEASHGLKLKTTTDCHTKRRELNEAFQNAFKLLSTLYDEVSGEAETNRSICLNRCTYRYKSSVEGIDGIDDQIQDAAGKIHEAQGEIARLEPMLHDVERAVDRMRTYVQQITERCGQEEYLGNVYTEIRKKIIALQECPGRNDFIINVPHWSPPSGTTPAPTPWYDNPLAEQVRTKL